MHVLYCIGMYIDIILKQGRRHMHRAVTTGDSPATPPIEVLREADLCQKLKVCPNTARKIRRKDPTFPPRRKIIGDIEGWLSSEVDAWLMDRPLSDRH